MSIYGHYNHQYYGNKVDFPKESFCIAGVKFNMQNCSEVTCDTELTMEIETENEYDSSAIIIKNNGKVLGYVPSRYKNPIINEMCLKHISEPLKVLKKKYISGTYSIRVIPDRFYENDVMPNMLYDI